MTNVSYKETLTNCTSNLAGKRTIPLGTTHIILTATNGYIFSTNGYYEFDNENTGDTSKQTITANNQSVLEFDMTIEDWQDNINLVMSATQQANNVSNFSNIYNPEISELNSLSSERIKQQPDESLMDFGQYIMNLYSLPFKLPNDIIGNTENIALGTIRTKTSSKKLLSQTAVIELGTITIPEKYHNSSDYVNTQVNLVAPYIDKISLPVNETINQTIKLTLKIDLFSGQGTLLITSNDLIIYSAIVKVSTDIPFIQESNEHTTGKQLTNINNGVKTAYIEVIRLKPINQNNNYPTLERGNLKDYNGYIEVSSVVLNSQATEQEQNTIISKLRSGVIIK